MMLTQHPGLRIHGESLRKAIRWMSDFHAHDCQAVEEASLRFDLSPLEEEFLLQHFVFPPDDIR
ncbi:hypothetical protein K0504_01485 [Neiella marina]|uniref:Uncharacterized protein n=1 Tax=Neiella holothuriorum TaxID=2870530 RepID=A0ABS7EBI3_9GAMM|nr:hypothetical protein [Neiella holothuriorum]MBW8189693.1 hypothetical protein [Neiella holothuriorum]